MHCICFMSVYPLCQCLSRDIQRVLASLPTEHWLAFVLRNECNTSKRCSTHINGIGSMGMWWGKRSAGMSAVKLWQKFGRQADRPSLHPYNVSLLLPHVDKYAHSSPYHLYISFKENLQNSYLLVCRHVYCLCSIERWSKVRHYFRTNIHGTEWREINLFFNPIQTVLWITHTIKCFWNKEIFLLFEKP